MNKVFKILFNVIFLVFLMISSFKKKLKVCLCSPGKKENAYLREFVEYYKSYKVDKIFLYDNNDILGESFEEVIDDYIKTGYVEVINFRGKKRAQFNMLNDCYKKNYLYYDWLIFYDIDEYIYLKNYNNIKNFLNQDKFKNCDTIQLNWLMHTDNNKVYYENKSLNIRFPNSDKSIIRPAVKSILKGKMPNIEINCVHRINTKLKTCNGFGLKTNLTDATTELYDYNYYYIDHYFCKSTEEFVNKINKGDVMFDTDYTLKRVEVYFAVNNATEEKINYMKKYLFQNISFDNIKIK